MAILKVHRTRLACVRLAALGLKTKLPISKRKRALFVYDIRIVQENNTEERVSHNIIHLKMCTWTLDKIDASMFTAI